MFLPIGDNVEKRDIPLVPVFLIVANVLVFCYEMRIAWTPEIGSYEIENFINQWALVPSRLVDGDVLGLLTYMFLHGSVMHILGNMAVLWAFAASLELGLGMWTLLGFYACCGLAGGVAHAFMDTSSEIPMIGASGAIAGLIGAYTVLYGPQSKIKCLFFILWKPFVVHIPAGIFGMGWIMMQFWHASHQPDGETGGVAWWCHIGGFVAGAVLAFICRNDSEAEMQKDIYGDVSFHKRGEVALDPVEEARVRAATNFPIPEQCTTCTAELTEEHRIANSLVRCGSCEQMIYLEPPPEPALSRR